MVISRRRFARDLSALTILGSTSATELFLAARSLAGSVPGRDVIWLNANENPLGAPPSAIAAIVKSSGAVARYHFDEFDRFTETIAGSESLAPEQVLFGIGSAEIINGAICAFTSSTRPLITATPTYEIPTDFAHLLGKSVVQLPLAGDWQFPVGKLVEEAAKAQGGLIYLCNPNNPTSSCTSPKDLRWLAYNLPTNTILLIDEAYFHFAAPDKIESGIKFVQDNCNVIVTRTFSKIYGMAGARVGFGCARPDLIRAMASFRSNVIPILGLRAAGAALGERDKLIPTRRASMVRTRNELCDWLRYRNVRYIEPHANFIMTDVGRDARSFGADMFRKGVAVGRVFPPLDHMLRVTIGTDEEMIRFREVFWEVYAA